MKIAMIVVGGLAAVIATMIMVGWNVDDSPKARLERIRDECSRTYGKDSQQSFDCFAKLMTRFAIEQRATDLDRTYRNAR